MEHSVHHTVLLEIHSLTARYVSILGGDAKDIYRMSNSFSAIAWLLGRRLQSDALKPCEYAIHKHTEAHILFSYCSFCSLSLSAKGSNDEMI